MIRMFLLLHSHTALLETRRGEKKLDVLRGSSVNSTKGHPAWHMHDDRRDNAT